MQNRLSLRTKIVLLVAASLMASGASYVILGAHLIIQDKTSYIYDYAASQVGVIAHQLDSRLSPLNELAYVMEKRNLGGESAFARSVAALLKLKVEEKDSAITESRKEFISLNVSPETKTLEVDLNLSGGKRVVFTDEQPLVSPDNVSREFSICIVSPKSKTILYSLERDAFQTLSSCTEILDQFQSSFLKGAQEISIKGRAFILSYENVFGGNILVMSLIPRDAAFSSARNLVMRSILLGFTLFFFTLGISLLVVRTLVSRINDLIQATQRISAGDFDVKLDGRSDTKDEVSLLSYAFNLMSGKIQNLLRETADKARMEKELETAQIVQNQFFPKPLTIEKNVTIEGKSLSATECGGDFWQFSRVGEKLIFVFGDITGHGVPAALLTATVYAVFTSYTESLKKDSGAVRSGESILRPLSESLNSTIYRATQGDVGFSCILCVFDLQAKTFHIANHGHPAPFQWNAEKKKWGAVVVPISPTLGQPEFEEMKVATLRYGSDLNLFFYTDGLFDQRLSDAKHLSKKAVLDLITDLGETSAESVINPVMTHALEFFGTDVASRPDDITLVQVRLT